MPPIFTNSAVTPSVFMELIFSTKAGGKVFSIPKRIPIFLSAINEYPLQKIIEPRRDSRSWLSAGRNPARCRDERRTTNGQRPTTSRQKYFPAIRCHNGQS